MTIEVNDIVFNFLISIGTPSVLFFLTKSIIYERLKNSIKNEYDQKLESYKTELSHSSKTEIEQLKSQLNIMTEQANFKFSKLHEKRIEAISQVYEYLSVFHFSLIEYTKPVELVGESPREVRRDLSIQASIKFSEIYRKKRIFLPKTVCQKIDSFNKKLISTYYQFHFDVDIAQKNKENYHTKWIEITENMSVQVEPALDELEQELRALLGDNPTAIS